MPGWNESTFGITNFDDLPATAKAYLIRLAELVETPVDIISTGPDRDQTIILRDPYAA
jgi:adenylosuccinate synthase